MLLHKAEHPNGLWWCARFRLGAGQSLGWTRPKPDTHEIMLPLDEVHIVMVRHVLNGLTAWVVWPAALFLSHTLRLLIVASLVI